MCIDMTLDKEMRSITSENAAADNGPRDAQLVGLSAAFFKSYVRQHCSVVADLRHEIKETELPPKEEPK